MDQEHEVDTVSRGLLEAISHAARVLDGQGRVKGTLSESFRMAARGLGAERAFLARVGAQREVLGVVESRGLSEDECQAVSVGRSAPGLSVSVVRRVIDSGRAQHVEDTRRTITNLRRTASLEGGEWSLVCAPVVDAHTGVVRGVLYFQTESLTNPLRSAVLPHVRAYAATLSQAWEALIPPLSVSSSASSPARRGERDLGPQLVGESEATLDLKAHLDRVALSAMRAGRPDPVLILGPTGTGKELVARYLHARSARARERFIPLNCATLRGDLVEATLFGYVKGAFTGAASDSEGLFVLASGGVLFLDEVGDMPPQGQSTLLRVLETRSVRPVGGREERKVDVQIMCATHVNLHRAVQAGRFREDLYHRIRGVTVRLKPLRERREDIEPLVAHYLVYHQRRLECAAGSLTPEARACLLSHDWPGNVRELSHVCSALVLHATPGEPITVEQVERVLREEGEGEPREPSSVAELFAMPYRSLAEATAIFERAYLERVAFDVGWNRSAVARRLQIDRKSLYRRMDRYKVQPPWRGSGAGERDEGDEHD